ncbi:hypothetical protein ABZ540_35330 [Nocardia xishanensis]|uniref:hypothetical protein n=1 Tax=Nocardia xishanensis TaxID=238964 RepID=UPI003410050E
MCDEDLDTFLTALYVYVDDHVVQTLPRPGRPKKPPDAELVCLAVGQALLGFPSEHHWLRFCYSRLGPMFPYLPKKPGYNKRIGAAGPLIVQAIAQLAAPPRRWRRVRRRRSRCAGSASVSP